MLIFLPIAERLGHFASLYSDATAQVSSAQGWLETLFLAANQLFSPPRAEEIKLEQKTKYGVVTAKRIAGSVVKVVSLEADSLRIESDGFQGTMNPGASLFYGTRPEYDPSPDAPKPQSVDASTFAAASTFSFCFKRSWR